MSPRPKEFNGPDAMQQADEDDSRDDEILSTMAAKKEATQAAISSTSHTTPCSESSEATAKTPTTTTTTTTENSNSNDNKDCVSRCKKFPSQCWSFYCTNEFLILVVLSILLAYAYPPLGAEYLHPEITATWMAVCLIFVMAGLGLKTQEFSKAFQRIWFNLFIQVFNFGVVSGFVYGVSRALEATGIVSTDLANGMVVASCLPMTMNMVFVLTKTSGGDEGLAIVNAAFSNLSGVFLSPLLILGYTGASSDVDLVSVFYKLAARVILPLLVGQSIQKCIPKVFHFYQNHQPFFKKVQELTIVFIVYTVFCRTFSSETPAGTGVGDILLMMVSVLFCLTTLMAASWFTTGLFWKNDPKLRVMALFGCTHKTIGIGLALINAIYENHPAVGLYTLPLLTWHPTQLIIGSFLTPRLAAYVERQEEIKIMEAEVTASIRSMDEEEEDDVDEDDNNVDNVDNVDDIEQGKPTTDKPHAEESETLEETEEMTDSSLGVMVVDEAQV